MNSLMVKIATIVIIGCMSLAILLSVVNLTLSKEIFITNFSETQTKIFNQIDKEYYKFYTDIAEIMTAIGSSEHLKIYFSDGEKTTLQEMNNQFNLGQSMKKSKISEYSNVSIFALSENGKSYMFTKDDSFRVEKGLIWNSEIANKAKVNRGKIVSSYQETGFTDVTKNTPVVVFAKAYTSERDGSIRMIAFITVKESDIASMYSYFTSSTSDIVLLNEQNKVISSNNNEYLEKDSELVEELNLQMSDMINNGVYHKQVTNDGDTKVYLLQRLQSSSYKIMGVINPDKAFKEQYNIINIAIPTMIITAIIVIILWIFVRQQTNPIKKLVESMSSSSEGHFNNKVSVQGPYEVRELSETYNKMVDELEEHIERLIQVEQDKRLTEIHALQMQINPHYMYNTLSSIKWLVWQGDAEKTIEVLDAFIQLLRNVISNTDECVTIKHEIENLKNYCLVNRARYGDAITVEFFVMEKYMEYEVPKLILQPIVENAFFHAFPEGGKGCINIFVKEDDDVLRFDIVDNGVGIKQERLLELNNKNFEKSDGFTSIGIGNVDTRLKLLYGSDYGVSIDAIEGKGTTVTITLPKNKKE